MRYKILIGVLFLTSCVESDIESYTDPDFRGVKFEKIIVDVTSLPDTARIEASKEIFKRLRDSKFEVVDITQILPPTRSYTLEEIKTALENSGYENILRIIVTSDRSKSEFTGYLNNAKGHASFDGNNIYGHSQSFSMPITSHVGQTTTTAFIYDTKSLRIAWQANISTKASGKVFVGNVTAIASSVVGKVIDQLKTDGH